MPSLAYQAVVLAGGEDKRLYPLTPGTVKALLPVAGKPLLSYPLRALADAGVKNAFIVVSGDKPAASVQSWISHEYNSADKMQCEVVTVPEDYGTADALRAVAARVRSETVVVVSGDLVTDLAVNALVASHQMNNALATVTLFQRKISPASETKPGQPPKNVDYMGLDPSKEHLLFCTSSPETLRDLKVPMSIIKKYGSMSIYSDLADAHLYVFNRSVLNLLSSYTNVNSLRQDLVPFLTQQQLKLGALLQGDQGAQDTSASSAAGNEMDQPVTRAELPGAHYMELSHSRATDDHGSALRVHIVPKESYCARVADVLTYGEVNREVADPAVALHLTGLRPSRFDNVVAASTTIGNKTTIAAGCMVGDNCVLGDKSSIKRSVMGSNCKLGANVKIINSVLMDNVVVGDGCQIQNSVICVGAQVKDKASLKDCQIGYGYVVPGGVEYKGEVLAKQPKA